MNYKMYAVKIHNRNTKREKRVACVGIEALLSKILEEYELNPDFDIYIEIFAELEEGE